MSANDGKAFRKKYIPEEVKGIPIFHVVSNPIEVVVERPLDIRFSLKQPVIKKRNKPLSDLFDLVVMNQSEKPVEIVANWGLRFEIEWNKMRNIEKLGLDKSEGRKPHKMTLNAGDSLALIGEENGLEGIWTYPLNDSVRIRAIYESSTFRRHGGTYKSEWIVVKLTEK